LATALESKQTSIISDTLIVSGQFTLQLRDLGGQFEEHHLPAITNMYKAIMAKLEK